MEEKCVLKPHFWFSFPKRAPSQKNFKYEEIPQIIHFLFLPPCLIDNSIRYFPVSSSLQQSGHCPWDLAKVFDITNSKGNVLTAPLIRQQRFIVIKQTLRAKLLLSAQATCSAWRAGHWKGKVPAKPRIGSAEREHSDLEFGIWRQGELDLSQESETYDKLLNILKSYMLSTLPGT